MAMRYNGLCDTDRMTVVALRYRMQVETAKLADGALPPKPETLLSEIIKEAKLSSPQIADERAILKAFYGGR